MTSMYATPGASMYMPATTMAAPVAVQAPATTAVVQTPSYVAPPVAQVVETVAAAPVVATPAVPAFGTPQPAKLTAGLADPAKVEAEKVAYNKALEAQLNKQMTAINEEAKIKKAMLEQQAKTQLAQLQLQIEEQLKMSCLQVDQDAQSQCNALKEAAITQQTAQEE